MFFFYYNLRLKSILQTGAPCSVTHIREPMAWCISIWTFNLLGIVPKCFKIHVQWSSHKWTSECVSFPDQSFWGYPPQYLLSLHGNITKVSVLHGQNAWILFKYFRKKYFIIKVFILSNFLFNTVNYNLCSPSGLHQG